MKTLKTLLSFAILALVPVLLVIALVAPSVRTVGCFLMYFTVLSVWCLAGYRKPVVRN